MEHQALARARRGDVDDVTPLTHVLEDLELVGSQLLVTKNVIQSRMRRVWRHPRALAWLVSGGDIDRAIGWYARGYYYEAKRLGLLEETGLRG